MRSFTHRGGAKSNGTEVIRGYRGASESDALTRHGLIAPVDIYPLYEQATRHAWGQTLAAAQSESAAIWEGNARVAADNPYAWIRECRSAAQIATPASENPLVTFPYTRSMIANSAVNQAAAVIVATLTRARELGIDESRLVHVGYGAAADEPAGNLERADFVRSPAMECVLEQTLARNELTAAQLDHVELYSCFPCVPKMARRAIGWPLDRPHSIYGGLSFGGGPIGNCMTHAVAALVRRIRKGSRYGLIFAIGGFATKNHAIVLMDRAAAGGRQARDYAVQSVTDNVRGRIPALLPDYRGAGVIETFSIPFSQNVPRHATIVARTPQGDRFLAHVPGTETSTLQWLMSDDDAIVGAVGEAVASDGGLTRWLSRSNAPAGQRRIASSSRATAS